MALVIVLAVSTLVLGVGLAWALRSRETQRAQLVELIQIAIRPVGEPTSVPSPRRPVLHVIENGALGSGCKQPELSVGGHRR